MAGEPASGKARSGKGILSDSDFALRIHRCHVKSHIDELSGMNATNILFSRRRETRDLSRGDAFYRGVMTARSLYFNENQTGGIAQDEIDFPAPTAPALGHPLRSATLVRAGHLIFGCQPGLV